MKNNLLQNDATVLERIPDTAVFQKLIHGLFRKKYIHKKLPDMQKLVSMFVDRIIIYPDKILIKFNFALQKCGLLLKKGKINLGATNVAPRYGGEV